MEADFQQFYGLDLERVGKDYSYEHAGRLIFQLPFNSRFAQKARGDDPWNDEVLLCSIANSLRVLPAQIAGKKSAARKVRQFGPSTKRRQRLGGAAMRVSDFDTLMFDTKWVEVKDKNGQH